MPVQIEKFLNKESFEGYEDPEKYKEWEPRVQKYRQDLENALGSEYRINLPKPIEELAKDHFNSMEYLRKEKLLTPEEFEITDSSATKLQSKIASSEWSSVKVYKAFAKRAAICHQLTNCALDFFFDKGLERAKFLDDYLKKNGKPIGPLHGIPISLKEQMNFKDRITNGGYVSMLTNIPKQHGITNQVLENLGAVFYVRTNQPQTLMHLDGNNNLIGLTRNPYNSALTSGGSSSGEGAIVAFGGSAIGVGSDIGGSIRAPAAYSGCHGLRPTTRRISTNGGVSSGRGQESVASVCGPMARNMNDIELWMKSYINDGKPWLLDAISLPMPWREVDTPNLKDLNIAVMYDDGLVKPTPPITRGLKDTVAKLEKAGAKIVEFKPIRTKEAYETVNKMYSCDGNYMQKKLLSDSGEPLTKLTKWCLNYGEGANALSVAENRDLNYIRDNLRQDYTLFMVENKIDFILCPAYNNVAPKVEEVYNWSYTSLFNLLDFPGLTFQTGLFQDPSIDKWDLSTYDFRSDLERLELENYIPEEFVGAPIGLQLVGRRYFDEEVVAAGKAITELLNSNIV